MFTPAGPHDATGIEASWGLGPSVVEGKVTPDAYRVAGDGSVTRTIADKRTRLDRHGTRLVTSEVPARTRNRPTIDDVTATRLAGLGREIAAVLGGPQDIEWAIADGRTWVLQARPITAAPPPPATPRGAPDAALTGTPGSHGTVTGTARIVRGPGDFARVRPGDILICPFTDPAWTPLLRVAAGVVTEIGGVLSHAAIVAREQAIPAVLGVPDVTSRLRDDSVITIDGSAGTVTAARA
jgi:pyruvate, water dikinase